MTSKTRSVGEISARRFAAQLLSGRPASDPARVAERLLAIQCQDLRGGQLAVRARSRIRTVAEIDRAFNEREIIVAWVNRGTLHLIRSEDYWLVQALTTPQLMASIRRRMENRRVTPTQAGRGVRAITRAIERNGPQTREQLRAVLVRAKVPVEEQALALVITIACVRGLIVRGPMRGTRQAFVLVREWLGDPPRPTRDREQMLRELAVRYLSGHGPATAADLMKWAGLPLRDVRAGFKAASDKIVELDAGLVDLKRRSRSDGVPPPKLLGPWEPLLVGWKEREWVLGRNVSSVVLGGLFKSFALVDGVAVATWTLTRGRPTLEPFAPIPRGKLTVLERDVDGVERFLKR